MARDYSLSFKLTELLSDKEAAYEFLREYAGLKIADTIRLIREAHDLTQSDVADMLQTTQSAVARMEDEEYRNYSLSTLTKFGEAFALWPSVNFEPYETVIQRILNSVESRDDQTSDVEVLDLMPSVYAFQPPETEAGSATSAFEATTVHEQKVA